MPDTYKRKGNTTPRGQWTSDELKNAINAINSQRMGINQAARTYGIPKSTLKRRYKNKDDSKSNRLGPDSSLGTDTEKKLALHIKKLQRSGFAPTRNEVRITAFNLAEKMGINHKFDKTEGKAGYKWIQSFLRRNPDISIRKAENMSVARSIGMSRQIVSSYFELLENILNENNLLDQPGHIYNCDETGLQLNTRPTQVLAEKGSKNVSMISPSEKGETISVMACCSAEGVFIPPYCIFKGKNKKDEFQDGMPPGSTVRMSEKSAYVNSELFYDWLKTHFLPRKMPGKILLILDGHTSHTTNPEMLQFAEKNEIVILCLPSHTTHYLQPLDRAFFKSLKTYYYDSCNRYIKTNATRKLTRLQFGKLLNEAWTKAATVQNALAGFRSTGIFPFSPGAIPDYAFVGNVQVADPTVENTPQDPQPGPADPMETTPQDPQSGLTTGIQPAESHRAISQTNSCPPKITPGKLLNQILPITPTVTCVRKRGRNIAEVLTSEENIKKRVEMSEKKSLKIKRGNLKIKKSSALNGKKKKQRKESISSVDSDTNIVLNDSSDESDAADYENECAGCKEDYRETKRKDDWIKCIVCGRWLHEGCTTYDNMCHQCGKHSSKYK